MARRHSHGKGVAQGAGSAYPVRMCDTTIDPRCRRPAVFLDRDGTLIEDRGHLRSPEDVVLYPETLPALRRLTERFELFIVTHQGGIGAGLLTAAEVEGVHRHLLRILDEGGVRIREVFTCPHLREHGCDCIKPHPRFLFEAASRYGLDLPRSYTVGDHPHDVEFGRRAGAQGIYVRTGHGEKHHAELAPDTIVVPGIGEAADWILAEDEARRRNGDLSDAIRRAAQMLAEGGVVAFPTETVYGLGAHALDPAAVARVFEIKGRPRFDPLIVHVADRTAAAALSSIWPETAERLARRFWPGPLTLVLPKSPVIPEIVTAGLPTVALRCPRHPIAQSLLRELGGPIAAPSANSFSRPSPTEAEHVREQLGALVPLVLDAGPCPVGVESTILSLAGPRPTLLRFGGCPVEDLERAIGPIVEAGAVDERPQSPGRLARHYSPTTTLRWWVSDAVPPDAGVSGLLTLTPPDARSGWAKVEVLSESGDLREAAARFFAAMRRLDAAGLAAIYARPVPEEGLGRAINDRLRRAAADHAGGHISF